MHRLSTRLKEPRREPNWETYCNIMPCNHNATRCATSWHHLEYQQVSHSLQYTKQLCCYQYERIYFDCIQFPNCHRSTREREREGDKQKGLLLYIETVKDKHLTSPLLMPWKALKPTDDFWQATIPLTAICLTSNYFFLYNLFLNVSFSHESSCVLNFYFVCQLTRTWFVYVQYPV